MQVEGAGAPGTCGRCQDSQRPGCAPGQSDLLLVASKNDLEDTQEGLGANSKMIADLEVGFLHLSSPMIITKTNAKSANQTLLNLHAHATFAGIYMNGSLENR